MAGCAYIGRQGGKKAQTISLWSSARGPGTARRSEVVKLHRFHAGNDRSGPAVQLPN